MNKLSILRTSCLYDRPERAHSDTKKEFERFLTWGFNELSLRSYR